MKSFSLRVVSIVATGLLLARNVPAAVVLSDTFTASTVNSSSPAAPTTNSTAYHLFSSKAFSPAPTLAANGFRFGIAATSSGHIEAHALFTSVPVALTNIGDWLEITVTFTNVSGLFAQSGHFGLGLYNSGGISPIAGGMNSTAVSGTLGITGGAQGWQGYVSRLAFSGGSHRLATRPAQSSTTGNNQDLLTELSGSQSYTGAVNLASSASTFSQPIGTLLTETLRLTLTAATTLQADNRIYSGGNTNGSLLLAQTGNATGANLLTTAFDALAIGWRDTGNAAATLIEIESITVASSAIVNSGPGNAVAGLAFQQAPSAAIAGAAISPAIVVAATNSNGAPVTNTAISLSLLSGSGPLNGTLVANTDANGLATFSDINLTSSGAKQLRASSGSFTADSGVFLITNAAASTLVFTTQPTGALVGAAITPAVAVRLRDVYGNNVASNVTVSVALSSGVGTLSGTTSLLTDVTGLATFSNLSINFAGTKQLTASAVGFAPVNSASFDITSTVKAFPGAEGAGAYTSGGRGGDVYYVTSLTDANTAGTLRFGINNAPAGGRTILFKVSGNIPLTSTLTINKPNITVAGQTAPGDGICIQNYSFNIAANNIIVRHMRTRLGTNALQEADSMWINSGTNIIVDHLSASWSVDETLSTSRTVANLTVQNCFITESLKNSIHIKGEHGYGGIISSENDVTYTYHHNLYAHNSSRNPRVGSDSQAGTLRLDFRNNVVYDWGFFAGYSGDTNENVEMNYVGNYFVAGPITTQTKAFSGGGSTTLIYQSSNYIDNDKDLFFDGVDTGWGMFGGTFTQLASPLAVPAMPTDLAPVALYRVIAQSGALPWRRDAIDQRIISSMRRHVGTTIDFVNPTPFAGDYLTNNSTGTNFIGVNPWPTLVAETAPADTDNDGMPDFWELANGLNPNLASDRNLTNVLTGFTRLEDYLNWRADAHALCNRNGFVDVNLRTATGATTNYSFAVSNPTNGTVALLGDGFTARFTAAANTNGVGGFTFTATDTATATSVSSLAYGILITTTNAPASNTAPQLAAITNRTVVAGNVVSFTASVTDTDTPPQTITFALQGGPSGATLGSSSGSFNWRPTVAQSPTTNLLSIVATDNGTPSLSATQSFTITVLRPAAPTLQSLALAGGSVQFQVTGDSGPDYAIETSTNLTTWSTLLSTNAPSLPWLWQDPQSATLPAKFYRIKLSP